MIKEFFTQLWGYMLIKMSIYAGIDDFSMSPDWDKDATLWKNAHNLFVKGE